MGRQVSVVARSAIALTTVALFALNVHATAATTAVDPSSAVRGSLGVSLEDLAIHSPIGELTLYLNGGMALLFMLLAVVAARAHARKRFDVQRAAAVPGGGLRATMAETWMRPMRG
jgi:hypothetical protein